MRQNRQLVFILSITLILSLASNALLCVLLFRQDKKKTAEATVPSHTIYQGEIVPDNPEETGRFHVKKSTNAENLTIHVTLPYVGGGMFSFDVPAQVHNLEISDKKITFIKENEWIAVQYSYEVADEIHSAPDAERKIKEVTDTLEYTSIQIPQDALASILYYLDELAEDDNRIIRVADQHVSLQDLNIEKGWYDSYSSSGAAYFYEESSNMENEGLIFHKLYSESYNYQGEVTLHTTIKVNRFNFKDYYNSLSTRIEREEAELEYENVRKSIVIPVDGAPAEAAEGIRNCLVKTIIME